ncbi:MAG: Ig-like domain-containing protein, partial [Actinomycetota bacterium]
MFNSSSARFARLITLAVAVLVLLPGMALGDNLQSDLNTSTGGQQKTVARGTLSPSTAYTQPVLLWVDETSGTTNNPSYPFNVTLDSATLNGNAFAGASFSGVQITAAGEANGKSGDAGWTTPAAQPTSQDYSLVVSFLANTTINESPSTITITFTIAAAPSDSTPPNTTIVTAPDATTSSTSASFTYSSNESGSTFACKLDAGSFASCPAAGKSYSGLGEGSHTFAVRATDGAGNTDPTPATYDWTIDLTPPAVSAPDLTAASDSGSSQVDDVTNDATPSFTGTAEDGASVELLRDGSPVDSTTATGGTWSFTSAALTDGTYGFAARATDAAGNVATSSA